MPAKVPPPRSNLLKVSLVTALVVLSALLVATRWRSQPSSSLDTGNITPAPSTGLTAKPTPTVASLPSSSPTQASSAASYQTQGQTQYQNHDYAGAIASYQQAITLSTSTSEQAIIWNLLGNAYRDSANQSQAVSAYQKAYALDPQLVQAYSNLSSLYVSQGNKTGARQVLDAGLAANPGNQSLVNAKAILDIQGTGATK